MASIEDLVPDILFLMLLKAESMEILWLFIRSSPLMYRIFKYKRDVILAIVIVREIGYGIMFDAHSALNSSRFKPRGLSKTKALDWLAEYQAGMTSNTILSGSSQRPDVLPLWLMHRDVKFFAELFVSDRLHTMTGGANILNSTEPDVQREYGLDQLSTTEKTRIYRAIYRYAIYGNLFCFDHGRQGTVKRDLLRAQEQSHFFLTLFPAWQVEELSCINDFIRDNIVKKWQENKDGFCALFKDDLSIWDLDREHRCNSRWETEYFISHSAKVNCHENWQRYLATLSLSELREIFTAKPEALLQVARKYANHYPHDFLTEALNEDPYHATFITPKYEEHEQGLKSGIKVQFREDAIDKPNEGWLWARGYEQCELYTESISVFPNEEGLRRFGYVFWDSHRLSDSGILKKESVYPMPQP
jgi:hypothetical protein